VSLTFDDGNADSVAAAPVMNAAGMHGTYYTNSGTIGLPGYQTRADLSSLFAAGNEIGGHSVTHPDLTALSSDEAKRQICLDRDTLLGWGFPVQNFAYPFAATNASVDALAQACGYNSARNLGDIQSRFGCAGCAFAESIPPAKPYELAAVDEADDTWTLADLQASVTNAQNNGGGWVILTFHHICANDCDPLAVSPELFSQFVSWLSTQSANNTTVKTVAQVIGGTTQPAVAVPPAATSDTVTNPSFETINATTNLPNCWAQAGFGANTATYDTVSPGHTGNVAARLTMSAYTDGDSKVMPILDLGTCAPSAIPGTSYQLSAWYTSTANTQFEVYLRTTTGGWVYWDASPYFAPATAWTPASWVTQPIPAGYDGIDFGLSLFSLGTLTTDDYSLTKDAAPVTTATVSPAAPNGTASWYTSQPTVTLTTPVTGLATTTQYSLDSGTTWLPYTAPVTIAAGTTTFSYRSTTATQTEVTHTLPFKVDIDLPVVTASFNDTTRTFSASATDATSGVASIQYRTPGGAWTTYTAPTAIGNDSTTLEFQATDVAGNVSASVNITEGAKTTATVSPAPADGLDGWYVTLPTVTLSAGTPIAGQVTQYSDNGTTWGTYSVPIVIPAGISTLYYRTISAGVTEPTQTLVFKVDSTPPVVSPSFDSTTRTYSATATDTGSGVASIQQSISGGPWTTYSGPTVTNATALTIAFRATDVAGNVSASVPLAIGALTTATVNPAAPNAQAGWYSVRPLVTLSTGSGQITQYSFSGLIWTTYTVPIRIPGGISTLRYRSIGAGITEATRMLTIKSDVTSPRVSASYHSSSRTVTAKASDVGSGVGAILWRVVGGTWSTYNGPVRVGSRAIPLQFQAKDVAGRLSAVASVAVPKSSKGVAVAVTLKLLKSTVTYLHNGTARVWVTSNGKPVVGGNVAILVGGKPYANVPLVSGGKAVVPLSSTLSAGKHSVVAFYQNSQSRIAVASAGVTQKVAKAATSIKIIKVDAPPLTTHVVRLTVTVHIVGSSLPAVGKISVVVNGRVARIAPLTAANAGQVVLTLPAFSSKVRTATIRAYFGGTGNLNPTHTGNLVIRIP
jgi:peptidoglycan/xylan/chitin deacetylase (PgdA/CDA1 family)